mgnify:CR=1 FL=1
MCGGGEHMQPREGQGRPVLGNPCVGNTLQWLLSFHTYGVMRAGIASFSIPVAVFPCAWSRLPDAGEQ